MDNPLASPLKTAKSAMPGHHEGAHGHHIVNLISKFAAHEMKRQAGQTGLEAIIPVLEHDTIGAEQVMVVNRMHQGQAAPLCSLPSRSRKSRNIVSMNQVWPLCVYNFPHNTSHPGVIKVQQMPNKSGRPGAPRPFGKIMIKILFSYIIDLDAIYLFDFFFRGNADDYGRKSVIPHSFRNYLGGGLCATNNIRVIEVANGEQLHLPNSGLKIIFLSQPLIYCGNITYLKCIDLIVIPNTLKYLPILSMEIILSIILN
jgi:hypothetical protein